MTELPRSRGGGNRIRLMTFTSHFSLWMARWRTLVVLATVAATALLWWRLPPMGISAGLPLAGTGRSGVVQIDWGSLREQAGVFGAQRVSMAGRVDAAWDDFRFAGTFSLYDAGDAAALRRAVVSYRPEQCQYIVSEGDAVGAATVVQIRADELVLRIGDQEGVLPLGGVYGMAGSQVQKTPPGTSLATVDPNRTRFGQRGADGVWQMDREALLAYYDTLLDDPERLLQVFDSMQPMYTPDGKIEGYRLQAVGEADFFAAVGFQEGDAVRAVNTLPMTNRRRAEFFIRQVVENDLSAIVIDIERDGAEQRLVYELR